MTLMGGLGSPLPPKGQSLGLNPSILALPLLQGGFGAEKGKFGVKSSFLEAPPFKRCFRFPPARYFGHAPRAQRGHAPSGGRSTPIGLPPYGSAHRGRPRPFLLPPTPWAGSSNQLPKLNRASQWGFPSSYRPHPLLNRSPPSIHPQPQWDQGGLDHFGGWGGKERGRGLFDPPFSPPN